MKRNRSTAGYAILVTLLMAGCAGVEDSSPQTDDSVQDRDRATAQMETIQIQPHAAVCGDNSARFQCKSRIRTDSFSKITNFATPSGLGPSDLVAAYKIDTTKT